MVETSTVFAYLASAVVGFADSEEARMEGKGELSTSELVLGYSLVLYVLRMMRAKNESAVRSAFSAMDTMAQGDSSLRNFLVCYVFEIIGSFSQSKKEARKFVSLLPPSARLLYDEWVGWQPGAIR